MYCRICKRPINRGTDLIPSDLCNYCYTYRTKTTILEISEEEKLQQYLDLIKDLESSISKLKEEINSKTESVRYYKSQVKEILNKKLF